MEIVRQANIKVKPNNILKDLRDRFQGEYPVNIRQVRYQKSKHETAEPIVNHGELINWLRSKKTVPTDIQ